MIANITKSGNFSEKRSSKSLKNISKLAILGALVFSGTSGFGMKNNSNSFKQNQGNDSTYDPRAGYDSRGMSQFPVPNQQFVDPIPQPMINPWQKQFEQNNSNSFRNQFAQNNSNPWQNQNNNILNPNQNYQINNELGGSQGEGNVEFFSMNDFKNMKLSAQTEEDKEKIFDLCQEKMSEGNVFGTCALGICYLEGFGTEKNLKLGVKTISLAAKKGLGDAMFELAKCYRDGFGVVKNIELALDFIEKAKNAGCLEAKNGYNKFVLSMIQQNSSQSNKIENEIEEKNEKIVPIIQNKNSMKMFPDKLPGAPPGPPPGLKKRMPPPLPPKKSIIPPLPQKKSIITSQNLLKDLTQFPNQNSAFETIKSKAESGDSYAMCKLGVFYYNGEGVKQDYEKAVFWYEKAVEAGNPEAMSRLGDCYYEGKGVKRDCNKSRELHVKAQKTLGYDENIDDDGLKKLINSNKKLEYLDLRECKKITNAGLKHLKYLKNLQTLNLSGGWNCKMQITDAVLKHLKGLVNLQTLDLWNCSKITNAGLKHLKGLVNLQTLNLKSCHQITNAGLFHLKDLKNLQTLNLSGCNLITDVGLAHLKDLVNLRELNLLDCKEITDAGLAHLKDFVNLQTLNLWDCKKITDAGLAHLDKLKDLQTLNLERCENITDAGLACVLTNLTKLKGFSFDWDKLIIWKNSENNMKKILDWLIKNKKFEAIKEIGDNYIEGKCCEKNLHKAIKLYKIAAKNGLVFEHLQNCTDQDLKCIIAEFPNLQTLHLSYREVIRDHLLWNNLIYYEGITDAWLKHLKGLKNLQTLKLNYCKKITDAGLKHLKGLKNLQTLDLQNCKVITDAGLANLKGLVNLKTLNLSGCNQITDAGKEMIKKAIPGLEI